MVDLEIQLSASFRLKEFLRSEVATRMGMTITPTQEEVYNLQRLCTTVLQPLRNEARTPIRILSGLRPAWLNNLIGGSKTSAHMFGCAADIEIEGINDCNLWICDAVKELKLPIDQCILEFPPTGWVHLGIERIGAERRNQFLTARHSHGVTQYIEGIHP